MSYGIIRVQKFKSSAVTGIQIHDKREKEKSHTNADIDHSKSNLNYSLIETDERPFQTQIKEKIDNLHLKKAVRKDAVVMCQILITSDKSFFDNITPEQEKKFFQDSLEFVKNRYGADNIISAEVHKDEKTPHLHINLVPIKDNKLSAKSLFDKPFLYKLQDDFYNEVSKEYGLERGGQEERQRHKTMQELKKETLEKEQERLDQLEQDIKKRQEKVEQMNINNYNEYTYLLTTEQLEPQVKSKSLFKKVMETPVEISKRINDKFIIPLIDKIKQLQSKVSSLEYQNKSLSTDRNRYMNLYDELTQGLSYAGKEQLKKAATFIKQEELKHKKEKERNSLSR